MSFKFNNWNFNEIFYDSVKKHLEDALNRKSPTSNICEYIQVKRLDLGHNPPHLEIMEIGELSMERFKGFLKLKYSGDACLILQTNVQVNPVTAVNEMPFGHPGMIAAHKPLIVPMQLAINQLVLQGICSLVVDKCKGVTLCFKNDPLVKVQVESTFDDLSLVKKLLQSEIERHLRELFLHQLPEIIHVLSRKYMGLDDEEEEACLLQYALMPSLNTKKKKSIQEKTDSSTSIIPLRKPPHKARSLSFDKIIVGKQNNDTKSLPEYVNDDSSYFQPGISAILDESPRRSNENLKIVTRNIYSNDSIFERVKAKSPNWQVFPFWSKWQP
jgi:hypothetical protein